MNEKMNFFEYLGWLYNMPNTSGLNYVVLATVCLACAVFVYVVVGGFISFVFHQVKAFASLYVRLAPVQSDSLHPYTRSLIANRTPEQALLARARKSGDVLAVRACVNDICSTLADCESNTQVKQALIRQFRRLQ
jgi:hypothetical protein